MYGNILYRDHIGIIFPDSLRRTSEMRYNGVCLGLCLAAAGCVAQGRTASASAPWHQVMDRAVLQLTGS